jgi:pullulanase
LAVVAEADAVRARLVDPGRRRVEVIPLAPVPGESKVWAAKARAEYLGWTYTYEIERDGITLGDIVDPWARLVRDNRGYIVRDTTPVLPRPPLDPQDAILYELHIRDFTRDPACGVKPEWQGKFLGLAQPGTRYGGSGVATGLDHIVELGVNVVQLMPVHAFSLPYNPEYEWGYMPNDFNAPHAGYASGVAFDAPITEFKHLVSALHERGLRVTLDVVYNHTAERWPSRLRSLMALAPKEFYRWKDDGTPWDGSACGNEFRSESPHGRRFIVESVVMWATEYGVDGFRFDLMGLIDPVTMDCIVHALKAIDPTILIYGEPWAGGPAGIPINAKGNQRSRGWACFNDEIRDGLRGKVFDLKDTGFLNAGSDIPEVKTGIVGGIRTFADSPLESINYIECHDNHTLEDRLRITRVRDNVSDDEYDRMSRLGVLMLMTAQGIPFLHSGQEFGRTKAGEDNTYNLGDQINNIRWSEKIHRAGRMAFFRDVIAMRKAHPMFRLTTRQHVEAAVRFFDTDHSLAMPEGTLGFIVTDVTGADTWAEAAIVCNGSPETRTVTLPTTSTGTGWTVAPLSSVCEVPGHNETVREVTLVGHCGAVLYRPR